MADNQNMFPIGTADKYIESVIGLYNYSIGSRNDMLFNNPLEKRYYISTSVYSPEIGEPYVMSNSHRNFDYFWGRYGGLVGYTYDYQYLRTKNSDVIANLGDIEQHQTFGDGNPYYKPVKLADYDFRSNPDRLYDTDILLNTNYDGLNNTFKKLDRLFDYIYTKPGEETKLHPRIENKSLNTFSDQNKYISDKAKYDKYTSDDEVKKLYLNGDSVDTSSYGNNFGETFKVINPARTNVNTESIGIYNELNQEVINGDYVNNELDSFDEYGYQDVPDNVNIVRIVDDENENTHSLLKKTNDLFKNGKIKSLINRFHIKEEISEIQSSVDESYGISRGRNLLKKNVNSEPNFLFTYDNPYCRVWTIANQYSKYSDLIRPFHESLKDFDEKPIMEGFRPFKNKRRGFSSIDNEVNGLPIIAPKSPEDVKRCMFSIENLAWKDINMNGKIVSRNFQDSSNRNSNRNVISKEQQGPNGGRIMWFPPYNLKFTENVNVNWNNNSFIGRGEQIYSYVNTDRGGTLDFTLLIDHPSILDIYSKSVSDADDDKETRDEDILRFFAGCGELEKINSESDKHQETSITQTSKEIPVDPTPEPLDITDKKTVYVFFPNNFSGVDYIDSDPNIAVTYLLNGGIGPGVGYEGGRGGTETCQPINGCIGGVPFIECENENGGNNKWYYQVDDRVKDEVLLTVDGYKDSACYGLNSEKLKDVLMSESLSATTVKSILGIGDMSNEEIRDTIVPFSSIDLLKANFNRHFDDDTDINLLDVGEVKIRCVGFASNHGHKESNVILAMNRARFLRAYLIKVLGFNPEWISAPEIINSDVATNNKGVSSLEAKLGRHAAVYIEVSYKDKQPTLNRTDNKNITVSADYSHRNTSNTENEQARVLTTIEETVNVLNEYDNEAEYFKKIGAGNDFIKKYIVDKVKYFDPAFHSITPEGFNARLTFLHQCTRQGPTVAASDSTNVSSAGNLAFGRAPVCVLRIGDFYNTRIIIDSISIQYDNNGGIQWDMNQEGIGLQPMYANVSISFKFLGGSDLSGPISRLQNAVSYNFFANTSVYDRRADFRNSIGGEVDEWQAGFNEKKDK